jgi:uracil phosphoribosyltransferase
MLRYLGLLITYEAMRNWLKVYKISIKQTGLHKEIMIIDPKESHVIIFSNLRHLSFFYGVEDLIPKSSFKLIKESEISKINPTPIELTEINSYTKIIIAAHKLNSEYTINLLNYLTQQHKVKINQIRLTSTTCTSGQLSRLSQEYSHLNIYTAKIA